jgi:P27 family predicted phage terminase small subunit
MDSPSPPAHLSAEGQKLWRDLTASFDFEPHETKLLRLALEALDRCNQARRALRRHGLTYDDRFGQPYARPEVQIERDARASFARLTKELGLPEDDEPAHGRPGRDRTGRYARRSEANRAA